MIPDSDQPLLQHPLFVAALGLSPLLARGETLITALAMGLVFAIALLTSALATGVMRRFIPWPYRLIFILLITATSVTILDRLMQAWLFDLHERLGVYVSLVAMNSLLLACLEETVLRRPLRQSLKTIALTGGLCCLIIACAGLIRGLLGRGGLLLDAADLLPGIAAAGFSVSDGGLPLMSSAAGAFLVLGCVIAAARYLFMDAADVE